MHTVWEWLWELIPMQFFSRFIFIFWERYTLPSSSKIHQKFITEIDLCGKSMLENFSNTCTIPGSLALEWRDWSAGVCLYRHWPAIVHCPPPADLLTFQLHDLWVMVHQLSCAFCSLKNAFLWMWMQSVSVVKKVGASGPRWTYFLK